eukprot:791804-Pelagomonas_calceolata.AAC.1
MQALHARTNTLQGPGHTSRCQAPARRFTPSLVSISCNAERPGRLCFCVDERYVPATEGRPPSSHLKSCQPSIWHLSTQVRRNVKSAVALPMPVHQMDDAQRAQLAEETGYKCIGKELPDDVT